MKGENSVITAPRILETLARIDRIRADEQSLYQGIRFEIEFLRKAARDLERLAALKERRLMKATAERKAPHEHQSA